MSCQIWGRVPPDRSPRYEEMARIGHWRRAHARTRSRRKAPGKGARGAGCTSSLTRAPLLPLPIPCPRPWSPVWSQSASQPASQASESNSSAQAHAPPPCPLTSSRTTTTTRTPSLLPPSPHHQSPSLADPRSLTLVHPTDPASRTSTFSPPTPLFSQRYEGSDSRVSHLHLATVYSARY